MSTHNKNEDWYIYGFIMTKIPFKSIMNLLRGPVPFAGIFWSTNWIRITWAPLSCLVLGSLCTTHALMVAKKRSKFTLWKKLLVVNFQKKVRILRLKSKLHYKKKFEILFREKKWNVEITVIVSGQTSKSAIPSKNSLCRWVSGRT